MAADLAAESPTETIPRSYHWWLGAALVSQLETAQRFTPFYHYSAPDPLRNGFSGWHLAALLAVVGVASAAALVVVDRRDLGA